MKHSEWRAEGERKFGPDIKGWKFVCPSCGYVASVQDWIDAEAERSIAFSCVGRNTGSKKGIGDKTGGPCNYAGGGLFQINPVKVEFEDGTIASYFAFADV